MIQISVSELKANVGKYVSMVNEKEIYITKNGKRVAKLTAPKQDKISAAMSLFDILPPEADLDKARMERLG